MHTFHSRKNAHKKAGALPPLFDRLHNNDVMPEGSLYVEEIQSFDQMIESISKELQSVLNTRQSAILLPKDDNKNLGYSDFFLPQYFGLGDFSHFDPSSKSGQFKMIKQLTLTIEHFEPRLKNVTIKIQFVNIKKDSAILYIDGDVILNELTQRVSFPITIDNLYATRSSQSHNTSKPIIQKK